MTEPRFVIPTLETLETLFYLGVTRVQEGTAPVTEAPAVQCKLCGWVYPKAGFPPVHLCPNDGQSQNFRGFRAGGHE